MNIYPDKNFWTKCLEIYRGYINLYGGGQFSIRIYMWSGTPSAEDETPAVSEGMFSSVRRMREIRTSGLTNRGMET